MNFSTIHFPGFNFATMCRALEDKGLRFPDSCARINGVWLARYLP